jgi:hypothetical protein
VFENGGPSENTVLRLTQLNLVIQAGLDPLGRDLSRLTNLRGPVTILTDLRQPVPGFGPARLV